MNAPVPTQKTTSFSERRRAAVSFFCGLCLLGIASIFYLSKSGPLFSYFSIVPILLGLLLFANGIHALLGSKIPPTHIVLGSEPLVRGAAATVTIRQEGPAYFQSLRANLVCERIQRNFRQNRSITYPCQENFFDGGRFEVGPLDVKEFQANITVPQTAEPSRQEARLVVSWRIEIWGKIDGRPTFMRPFEVEVV